MKIVCSDLEGVWIPEIWIEIAKISKIDELKFTTREIKNYDLLMQNRLKILKENKITLDKIMKMIENIEPFEGAIETLNWIRQKAQLIIVSDTFYQFAMPLMQKMNMPTIFCHSLVVDSDGFITDYKLRQKDPKKETVKSLKKLKYEIVAFGDSYNDIDMIKEADKGLFFSPPQNVQEEYKEIPAVKNYQELKDILEKAL